MIVKKDLNPPPVHPVSLCLETSPDVGPANITSCSSSVLKDRQIQADRVNDLPPPYVAGPNRSIPSSSTGATHHRENVQDPNILSVNQIHINNRHEDVVGTYCIDPTIPCKRRENIWRRPRGLSAMDPNASFQSRHGAISINLATSGTTANRTKAYIQASTRRGDIDINVYSLQKEKHIALDVHSRHGNVSVRIPKNFCGAIQLHSRKTGCKVLPELASSSRTLAVKDNEVLVLVGDPGSTSNATQGTLADDVSTDFCQLASRTGRVTIGFTGEIDNVPEVNLWKKLGEYLWGLKLVK